MMLLNMTEFENSAKAKPSGPVGSSLQPQVSNYGAIETPALRRVPGGSWSGVPFKIIANK